jgi:hypothetical protein
VTEKPRPLRESRSSIPEHVEWAIAHALEKLSADRFATAREFADALDAWAFVTRASAAEVRREKGGGRRVLTAAGVSGLVMVAIGYGVAQVRAPADTSGADVVRFAFTPPPNQRFTNNIPGFGVSPDGRAIAYRGLAPNGAGLLYVRYLDDLEPRLVKGVMNPSLRVRGAAQARGPWADVVRGAIEACGLEAGEPAGVPLRSGRDAVSSATIAVGRTQRRRGSRARSTCRALEHHTHRAMREASHGSAISTIASPAAAAFLLRSGSRCFSGSPLLVGPSRLG